MFLSAMSGLIEAPEVGAIWVTPLLGLDYVRDGLLEKRWRSLIVAGSADPYHDSAAHAEVFEAIAADSLVIDGADHGLVVHGDVRGTVDGFRALAEASLTFAAR